MDGQDPQQLLADPCYMLFRGRTFPDYGGLNL